MSSSSGHAVPILGGTGYVFAKPMRDSSPLLESCRFRLLRSRLEQEGYLLLRGYLNRNEVKRARESILLSMKEIQEVLPKNASRISLLQHQEIAAQPIVRHILEHPKLFDLLFVLHRSTPEEHQSGDPSHWVTLQYKWLRAVLFGEFTGLHTDEVYFGSSTTSLHTIWIPFGDLTISQGSLLVSTRYHNSPEYEEIRASYGTGHVGKDGTDSGWFSRNACELEQVGDCGWVCSDVQMGDVLLLNRNTMHMSTTNTTDLLRISCDTRWHLDCDSLGPAYRVSPNKLLLRRTRKSVML